MFKLFLLLSLLTSSWAFSQEVIPGLIPRFYSIEAAVDLPIQAEIAHERALRGFDLSTLDPDQTTNLWKPQNQTIPSTVLINSKETVRFVKGLPSRSGQLRFTVATADNRELIVILSKKAHNFLLRRNILAKLGYSTQPMSWLPKFDLVFEDTIDRDLFKEDMQDKLLAGTDRWIKSQKDLTLSLQDALVLTSESDIYNLATGLMRPEVHQGRRILRAAYMPLAIVDATESVNLMPWQAGRVVLNNLKMNHTQDLDTTFGTSWEDARWIGRRIGKLTRADLEEIVIKASYPEAVEKLLIEKIVSRRNDLMDLLLLGEETQKLTFNPEINFGTGLKAGEIVQEFFDGYSSRFSYGDPESPFSASELGSFALSRAQSELINAGMGQLNKLLGTDEKKMFTKKIEEIVKKEGPYFSTKAIMMPTFHGSVILSRDIITGSYLGTNNKVQLVDNLGFSLSAGGALGIVGLPVVMSLKGGASLSYQRMFSHVKPVQSLKKSLKEPYRNMLVPMLLKDIGNKIDKLSRAQGAAGEALMQSVVTDLKGTLGIGESFIITDSLVPNLIAEAEISVSQFVSLPADLLKVYAQVQSQRMMLTRFHLHRANEHTFQIYQDYGKNLKLMMTLKLKSYIPVVSFNGRWNTATAETHFYPLSLHPQDVTVGMLKGLRQSIYSLNHSGLREVVTPHKVDHAIKGGADTLQFLMFKRNSIGSNHAMKLTHAVGGAKKEIHRRYDAVTSGTDLEGYAVEAVNSLISLLLKSDLALSQVSTMNPGFSVGGKARNRVFTSEYDGSRMTTSFERILNGWRVKPQKLKSYLKLLNDEAGRQVFDPLLIINTDSILLYQISYTYTLTQEGVDRLFATTLAQLKTILTKHARRTFDEEVNVIALRHFNQLQKIGKKIKAGDPSEAMGDYHDWLKNFQNDVTVLGLETIVGIENFASQGRIEGFRQGDENGDNPVFSHVFGQLPLALHSKPTEKVMQNWGILEGELLANWITERAI